MVTFDYFQRFKGDIRAHEELSTNTKGGSISTVVKGSVMNFVYLVWPMRVLDTVTH
ncbi:hypothetical protein [uncultured Sulfitobacter sp.]|uniref:hypothetical protein n=1 Tax=uncultured Sulfitobacter sp. TaxID=191468 RepID=UPI0032B161E8